MGWMETPDAPGWWAFDGAEWTIKNIYSQDELDEDEERKIIGYEEGMEKPFQTVLLVRYSTPGESVHFRRESGPYHGDPILGYLKTHHSWDHNLQFIDRLIGKWQRLNIAWENGEDVEGLEK